MKFREFLKNTLGKFIHNVDWINTPTSTYVRYILAIIAAINAILNAFNMNPIVVNQDKLYNVISAILFVVILFVNTYEDNPTSPEAIESNKYLMLLLAAKENGEKVERPQRFVELEKEFENDDDIQHAEEHAEYHRDEG